MSTRARIKLGKTGENIYCHWDGSPNDTGVILLKHYNKKRKLKKLLKLGNLSFLEKRMQPTKKHTFNNPQDGVTVAYHRDRGEIFQNGDRYGSVFYTYVFEKGMWFLMGEDKNLTPLKEIIKNN